MTGRLYHSICSNWKWIWMKSAMPLYIFDFSSTMCNIMWHFVISMKRWGQFDESNQLGIQLVTRSWNDKIIISANHLIPYMQKNSDMDNIFVARSSINSAMTFAGMRFHVHGMHDHIYCTKCEIQMQNHPKPFPVFATMTDRNHYANLSRTSLTEQSQCYLPIKSYANTLVEL